MTLALEATCAQCGTAFKPEAAFCAQCGNRRIAVPVTRSQLGFVLALYMTQLACQMIAAAEAHYGAPDLFQLVAWESAALAAVTVAFALARASWLRDLYRSPGFSLRGYALVLLAAPVVLGLVVGYVAGLEKLFHVHMPDEVDPLRSHGLAPALALIVIGPPVFEELAFRGLMYTGLRKTLRVSESFIISSFAFALLHLSIPSLLTHFPLGLYLCWLRHTSGRLWPGMFAHALHNAGVVVISLAF